MSFSQIEIPCSVVDISIEVRVENETAWLSQAQMADLFGTGRQAITKHIKNIYECGELQKEATCSILELVRLERKLSVFSKMGLEKAVIMGQMM